MKDSILLKAAFFLFSIFLLLVLSGCMQDASNINSFEECAGAGFPVMESYPRQCRSHGKLFVEQINDSSSVSAQFHECSDLEKQNEACTREYEPVCGIVDNGIRCIKTPCASTDAVTYGNGCTACAAKAYGYYASSCEELEFVVCGETQTGFDPVKYAQDSGGICVDICPRNYDGFVTQIGIELCIEHYDTEEISQWDNCIRSSESCECVKAYETTSEDEITDAQYRCVPKMYAERLLFRGGVDRLDEKGKQSVMIV